MSGNSRRGRGQERSSASNVDPDYARYLLWLVNGGTQRAADDTNEVTYTHRGERRLPAEEQGEEHPNPSTEFVRELEDVVEQANEVARRKKERSRTDNEVPVKTRKEPDDDVGPSGSTRSRMQLRGGKPSKR